MHCKQGSECGAVRAADTIHGKAVANARFATASTCSFSQLPVSISIHVFRFLTQMLYDLDQLRH